MSVLIENVKYIPESNRKFYTSHRKIIKNMQTITSQNL